jgi:aconitate decarboxylase
MYSGVWLDICTVRKQSQGDAAWFYRNGLLAALLARIGYVGIKKLLERPYGGFLAVFGQGSGKNPSYLPDEIAKELSTKWQTNGIRVKPYAAMAATHGTVDCIQKLQKEHPGKMKDLRNIAGIKLEMGAANV